MSVLWSRIMQRMRSGACLTLAVALHTARPLPPLPPLSLHQPQAPSPAHPSFTQATSNKNLKVSLGFTAAALTEASVLDCVFRVLSMLNWTCTQQKNTAARDVSSKKCWVQPGQARPAPTQRVQAGTQRG